MSRATAHEGSGTGDQDPIGDGHLPWGMLLVSGERCGSGSLQVMRTGHDRVFLIAAVSAAFFIAVLSAAANTNASELVVDGIVQVKGNQLAGTQAVIVSDDAGTMVLRDGLSHFEHTMRLQTRYLISFEREGCVTKQILFDTHVPADYLERAPFKFLFEVTLRRPPSGAVFEYAGPVGYVRFMPNLKDFGYDTDYRIKSEPALVERVRAFHLVENTSSSAATQLVPLIVAPVEVVQVVTERMAAGDVEVLSLRTTIPLVHLTGRVPLTPALVPRIFVVHRAVVPMPITEPTTVIARPRAAARVTIDPVRSVGSVPEPAADGRDEQLLVEPRRVTTIVRITLGGRLTEFRRVANQYGPVFFFTNGLSCSERQYAAGVGTATATVAH